MERFTTIRCQFGGTKHSKWITNKTIINFYISISRLPIARPTIELLLLVHSSIVDIDFSMVLQRKMDKKEKIPSRSQSM